MLGWDINDLVIIILNIVFIISSIKNIIIINNVWVCLLIMFLDKVFIDLFLLCVLVYRVFMLWILVKKIVLNII